MEKLAFFKDKDGNSQVASINISENQFALIRSYLGNDPTGYMYLYFHPNNRLYLDVIYCYDKYRKLGVASYISDLADYILKDYEGYLIRDQYYPTQLSTDRKNGIWRSHDELDKAARKFYEKNGYEILKYDEYLNNRDIYPNIFKEDFCLSEMGPTTIVLKTLIHKEYNLFEDNGIIYQKNNNILKLSK